MFKLGQEVKQVKDWTPTKQIVAQEDVLLRGDRSIDAVEVAGEWYDADTGSGVDTVLSYITQSTGAHGILQEFIDKKEQHGSTTQSIA
jgi:hypothetical protein